MDQLRQIEVFTTVVQNGSFIKAADRLGISRAVASRLVMELETALGTRLLNRTTRRLSLTDSGAEYFERCRQVLDDLAEANAAASATTVQPAGRLKINAPLTFGNLHLAPLWGEFLKAHPKVTLDVTLSDRVVDLVDEGFDLAIRISVSTRPQNSTLVARRLSTDRMRLCASPTYLKQVAPISQLPDLGRHSVMAYSYWSSGDVWTFEGPAGHQSVTTHPRLHANSGDTCRAAALADQGLVLQPGFLVGPDLKEGRLVEVLPQYRGPELDIHAVYPSRKHLSGKVRAMVDFLVEAFRQPGWL